MHSYKPVGLMCLCRYWTRVYFYIVALYQNRIGHIRMSGAIFYAEIFAGQQEEENLWKTKVQRDWKPSG